MYVYGDARAGLGAAGAVDLQGGREGESRPEQCFRRWWGHRGIWQWRADQEQALRPGHRSDSGAARRCAGAPVAARSAVVLAVCPTVAGQHGGTEEYHPDRLGWASRHVEARGYHSLEAARWRSAICLTRPTDVRSVRYRLVRGPEQGMGRARARERGREDYLQLSDTEEDDLEKPEARQRLSAQSRLIIALVLNLGYTLAELGAYYAFDSLAMLADAVHNLSDVASIAMAYKIEGIKSASDRNRYTFGVKRAEVLGGVLNGTVLLALCLYVICDAVPRLVDPPALQITRWFIGIAVAGVPVNVISACLFIGSAVRPQHAHSHGSAGHGHSHGHSHGEDGQCPSEAGGDDGNMNLWAVFLHNLGDALTSVGVTIVAVLLYKHGRDDEELILGGGCASGRLVFGSVSELGSGSSCEVWTEAVSCGWVDYLDASVSIFLSVMISLTVMPLLRQGVPVLLDSSPVGIDLGSVQAALARLDGVVSIDALHIWQVDSSRVAGIVHAEIKHGACRDEAAAAIRAVMTQYDVVNTSVQINEAAAPASSASPGIPPGRSPRSPRLVEPGSWAMSHGHDHGHAHDQDGSCPSNHGRSNSGAGTQLKPAWPWRPA